jgi:O-antigen/teichoic acid export membrane protein
MTESILTRFIKGAVSVGLGSMAVMVMGLLGMIVAVRHLPIEDYGAFVLLLVIVGFLVELSSFGLDLAIPKFLATLEDQTQIRRLINSVVIFRGAIMLLMSILAIIAKDGLELLFGASLFLDLIIYIPVMVLAMGMYKLVYAVLQGMFNFKMMGFSDFFSSLLNFILVIALVIVFQQGIIGLIYAKTISFTVSTIVAYIAVPVSKRIELDVATLRKMIVFGFPLQVNYILTFIFLRMDTLVIATLLGPAQIAYYEIARKIPEHIVMAYDAFRTVYYPFIARMYAQGEVAKATRMINQSIRWLSLLATLGALIALLFGTEIITLLFSDRYLPSTDAFVLLMLALHLLLLDYTMGYSLVAIGDSNKPAIINVVRAIVGLASNLILIPIMGIVGAALASILGFAVANPLNVFFLRRRTLNVNFWIYLKPLVIFGCFALAVTFFDLPTLFERLAVVLLFLVVCVLTSVITIGDVTFITRELRIAFLSSRQPKSVS